MLSLHPWRIALIRIWEPSSDDNHLTLVDHIRAATSVRKCSGTVVGRIRFDPRERWERKDVSIVIGERVSKAVASV